MRDISTDAIEQKILDSARFHDFLDQNENYLDIIHPGEYLQKLLDEKSLKKKDLVAATNLNIGYAYEIFRQEKKPERDKLLQFAFAFPLTIEETQQMLKRCGYALLYGKNKRDAAIMFCISRRKSLIETNILLHEYEFSSL